MFQNITHPWVSIGEHADVVDKYNHVCHIVHELCVVIKHLENKMIEIERK